MPVITVSRMFGSGGSVIARRVADTLGWRLLDNAFVERVAARLHATPAAIAAMEEHSPSLAERIAEALALSAQEMLSAPVPGELPPSEDRVLQVTREVIEDELARGPVVVVGRGAQMCLAERMDALHVLCTAPHPALVARVMEREHLTRDEARRRVDEENRRRESFVRRYWNREWLDARHYHLSVNTAWLGIEGTAQLIVEMAGSLTSPVE